MDTSELLRRYYDEVWVKGNVDAVDEFLAIDYVDHTPGQGASASPLDDLRRVAAFYRDTTEDRSLDLQVVAVDGDIAACFWTMEWTQHGEFFGAAADGKRLELRGGQFWRIRDGRLAETWHAEDYLSLFGSLGLTPKP
jgi:steroid delta-isomerase-like uncharacterized protein